MLAGMMPYVGGVRQRLLQSLQAEANCRWFGDRESGCVDPKSLHRLTLEYKSACFDANDALQCYVAGEASYPQTPEHFAELQQIVLARFPLETALHYGIFAGPYSTMPIQLRQATTLYAGNKFTWFPGARLAGGCFTFNYAACPMKTARET